MTAFAHTTSIAEAASVHPWATHAIPCLGGVKLFDSPDAAEQWINDQKARKMLTSQRRNEHFIKTIKR